MRIAHGRRLDIAHRGEVAAFHGLVEILDVVRVVHRRAGAVFRIGVADIVRRGRTLVGRVGGGGVVLEPGVVRDVVGLAATQHVRIGAAGAAGAAVLVHRGEVEAAHETAPADMSRIEQVADVLRGHPYRFARIGADVVGRIGIAGHGIAALAIGRHAAGGDTGRDDRTGGRAGDDMQRARRRRTVGVGVGVVVHRETLRVIPQRGDGVAVVVAHHQSVGTEGAGAADGVVAGMQREEVGLAVVVGLLFRRVAVILAFGIGLGAIQAERIDRVDAIGRVELVGIRKEQAGIQAFDLRRERPGVERRLAVRVGRMRIGGEVVIEGAVLVEDHHQVLDRRGGPGIAMRRVPC